MKTTEEYEPLNTKSNVYYGDYQSLATNETNTKIVDFNNCDDIMHINHETLLIFGYIRIVQNLLLLHVIIPQTVIKLVCDYYQVNETHSVYQMFLESVMSTIHSNKFTNCKMKKTACPNNVQKMFVNGNSLFLLTTKNHVYASGDNKYGQLALPYSIKTEQFQTTDFYQKNRFKIICSSVTSSQYTFAVTMNDKVYAFGRNEYSGYKLFGTKPSLRYSYLVPNTEKSWFNQSEYIEIFWPTVVEIKYKLIDIRLGHMHALFLTSDGKVLSCGDNFNGQCGVEVSGVNIKRITLIENLLNYIIIKIRCGVDFSMVLTDDGILKSFGSNDKGQLGSRDYSDDWEHRRNIYTVNVGKVNEAKIKTMECGFFHAVCLNEHGKMYSWGAREGGAYQSCNSIYPMTQIVCGHKYTVAMDSKMNLFIRGFIFIDIKYTEYKHLIGNKDVIDIKGGPEPILYLCVSNT